MRKPPPMPRPAAAAIAADVLRALAADAGADFDAVLARCMHLAGYDAADGAASRAVARAIAKLEAA